MTQWRHPVLNFMLRFRQQWDYPRASANETSPISLYDIDSMWDYHI